VPQAEHSAAETATGNEITFPLDEFYRLAKRPLPAIESIDGQDVPPPYQSLLVHERDMTSTLGQFHSDAIELKVLSLHNSGDAYYREVLLLAKRNQQPVEYGAIKICLEHFSSPTQDAIVSAAAPLGQLLASYSIQYLSRPSGFLVIECDDYIGGLFNYQDRPKLFGRRNTLYDAKSRAQLAEIIEILPIN